MATSTLVINISWENNNAFQMTANKNGTGAKTITKNDENSNFVDIWNNIQDTCIVYLTKELNRIGTEMKA